MHTLTELIYNDMKPALGVTEPGAIAFAVAKARSYTEGEVRNVTLVLNSGMYKNAFTCGIPNCHEVGNVFSAALGLVAENSDKELMVLEDITEEDTRRARRYVEEGLIDVVLGEITPVIFIEASVETEKDRCTVTIQKKHTRITRIEKNGQILLDNPLETEDGPSAGVPTIHRHSLGDIYAYITSVPLDEIRFIMQAYVTNLALFEEGMNSSRTTFGQHLKKLNKGMVISDDALGTAQLLCNATIEARVIGLNKPAMSITGSGAHGIIATMPLYALVKVLGLGDEALLRATALSYLVTMYIKEYSGALSALCGCAVAAGTGAACGLTFLRGGGLQELTYTIYNMASSITGMICDGGNQGCTMKGVVGVDAAFRSSQFAMNSIAVDNVHGINARTPEETMRNIGLIASPGMVQTEKTIVDIFEAKLNQ